MGNVWAQGAVEVAHLFSPSPGFLRPVLVLWRICPRFFERCFCRASPTVIIEFFSPVRDEVAIPTVIVVSAPVVVESPFDSVVVALSGFAFV